jgi:hypothetical protein
MKIYVIAIEEVQRKPQSKAKDYIEIFSTFEDAKKFGVDAFQNFIKNRDKNFGVLTEREHSLFWYNTETNAIFSYKIFEKELNKTMFKQDE